MPFASINSLSSLDVYLVRDDANSGCTSSTKPKSEQKRWEPVKSHDGRPSFPRRQESRPTLLSEDSGLTLGALGLSEHSKPSLLTQDSLATSESQEEFVFPEEPEHFYFISVKRSESNDFLPQKPRRQLSGKHLVPPAMPRRQTSDSNVPDKVQIVNSAALVTKSKSLPSIPCRYPSFQSRGETVKC